MKYLPLCQFYDEDVIAPTHTLKKRPNRISCTQSHQIYIHIIYSFIKLEEWINIHIIYSFIKLEEWINIHARKI
jgi:hypothetical protein